MLGPELGLSAPCGVSKDRKKPVREKKENKKRKKKAEREKRDNVGGAQEEYVFSTLK